MEKTEISKKELRKHINQLRNSLPESYYVTANKAITNHVLASQAYKNSRSIFVYISTAHEPSTQDIISTALADGKVVCVPKCWPDKSMSAIVITDCSQLVPGPYNIPEPIHSNPVLPPESIDLGIIPCISAGIDGSRLGHGAGYYDRFLASSHIKTICLCYNQLLSSVIPMDKYDLYMDSTVTECGFYS